MSSAEFSVENIEEFTPSCRDQLFTVRPDSSTVRKQPELQVPTSRQDDFKVPNRHLGSWCLPHAAISALLPLRYTRRPRCWVAKAAWGGRMSWPLWKSPLTDRQAAFFAGLRSGCWTLWWSQFARWQCVVSDHGMADHMATGNPVATPSPCLARNHRDRVRGGLAVPEANKAGKERDIPAARSFR